MLKILQKWYQACIVILNFVQENDWNLWDRVGLNPSNNLISASFNWSCGKITPHQSWSKETTNSGACDMPYPGTCISSSCRGQHLVEISPFNWGSSRYRRNTACTWAEKDASKSMPGNYFFENPFQKKKNIVKVSKSHIRWSNF